MIIVGNINFLLLLFVKKHKSCIKRKNRKPIAYKVKKKHVNFILDEIKKRRTITLTEIMEKLNNKFPNLEISKYHISRIIKDNDVTLKLRRTTHNCKI